MGRPSHPIPPPVLSWSADWAVHGRRVCYGQPLGPLCREGHATYRASPRPPRTCCRAHPCCPPPSAWPRQTAKIPPSTEECGLVIFPADSFGPL
eukprot:6759494-Pyramimonas_sp.AAC.1